MCNGHRLNPPVAGARVKSSSKSFQSKASYEDVKRFYVERMTQDGWMLARERQLKDWGNDLGGREIQFRRDNYQVTIEYAGESADYGWEYGIGVGWSMIDENRQRHY